MWLGPCCKFREERRRGSFWTTPPQSDPFAWTVQMTRTTIYGSWDNVCFMCQATGKVGASARRTEESCPLGSTSYSNEALDVLALLCTAVKVSDISIFNLSLCCLPLRCVAFLPSGKFVIGLCQCTRAAFYLRVLSWLRSRTNCRIPPPGDLAGSLSLLLCTVSGSETEMAWYNCKGDCVSRVDTM